MKLVRASQWIRSHTTRRRHGSALTALVAAVALALAGCGGDSSGSGSGSGSTTLNVGRAAELDSLDPHATIGANTSCQILCSIYDRLVEVDAQGALVPGVAESWEYGEDGKVLTFHLRDDVTFSDGSTLDATAVKTSLDRARTMENSPSKTDLVKISSVEVVDPVTVTVRLSAPDSRLPGILSGVPGTIINPKAIESGEDLSKNADGSGPFEVVSYTPDSEVKLKAREGYWGDKPDLENLNFTFITDQAAMTNALLAGQLDIANVSPANLTAFEGNDQFKIQEVPTLSFVTIITNWQLAGLTDVRARQALLYATDRQALCDQIEKGYCSLTDQPFPEGYVNNDPSIDQVLYPYDPEKAKELLAEAGITDLKLSAMMWEESLMPVMQAVQEQWKAVGIDLDIQLVDAQTMVAKVATDKNVAMAPNTTAGEAEPARKFSTLYVRDAFFNPGPVTTDKLQDLYDQILVETDQDARTSLLQAASREVAESASAIVLYDLTNTYVMKSGVQVDFGLKPVQSFDGASFGS